MPQDAELDQEGCCRRETTLCVFLVHDRDEALEGGMESRGHSDRMQNERLCPEWVWMK